MALPQLIKIWQIIYLIYNKNECVLLPNKEADLLNMGNYLLRHFNTSEDDSTTQQPNLEVNHKIQNDIDEESHGGLDVYDVVGKYKISYICLESYPCQHMVINTEVDAKKEISMNGIEIYQMLKKEGLYNKHFDEYCNCRC